jgi:hypothetical protein
MVALVVITGMHFGIGFLMGIMYFSLAMIAVDMMLVSDKTWLFASGIVQRQWARRFPARVRSH